MSILKYKYKAHKFINYAFYIVVFIFGFLLGFTTNKIDFNKLISQVLMIDNVSALTIYENDYHEVDEKYIYDAFFEDTNYLFDDYPYILCSTVDNRLICKAFNNIDNLKVLSVSSSKFSYQEQLPFLKLDITFNTNDDSLEKSLTYSNSATGISSSFGSTYTNFDFINGSSLSTVNEKVNKLNFVSMFLEFNENLFKNNPDFKEVCVPNNKDFAISTNNFELIEDENSPYNGTKSYSSYEFLWFPYYPKGLESYLYANNKPDNVWIPEEDDTYFDLHPIYHYWFYSKDEIDKIWNLEDPGKFLNSFGYTDKYSYFGWYTHPFVVRYANSGLRQFSIFRFNEDFEFYSTLENGIDSFEKLEEARNGNVCFYIRKDFDVNLLNTDEFGDKYGDITIMGDEKLEISTSVNISNLDSKGLFEKVKLFLNEMSDSIDFVKDYIFNFYDSMPYLLKLFIISVFGLIVIKILIGMVVR